MLHPRVIRSALLCAGLTTPALAGPDSVVTFNELHFHPPDPVAPAVADPEWIELHNQMSIRVDLGGWTLRGGITYTFPEGTTIEPGAFAVISQAAGTPTGALGPWTGRLDNNGERISLHERWGRLMDVIEYGDTDPWPTAPDGSGPTLAKSLPDRLSNEASQWAASAQTGGTPGAGNFPDATETSPRVAATAGSSWKYATAAPAPEWTHLAGFDDSGWTAGVAPLGTAAPTTPPAPVTGLPPGLPAVYFRKFIAYSGGLANVRLLATGSLKGDATFHVNGVELRQAVGDGPFAAVLTPPALLPGSNVLAVELRPPAGGSEIVLDLAVTLIDGETAVAPAPDPHQAGSVVINEVAYHSRPTYPDPAHGINFAANPAEWLELHNPGSATVELSGWRLRGGIDYDFPAGTVLPPGGFHVVSNLQFSGSLGNDSDMIRLRDAGDQTIDEVRYFDSGRWPAAADGGGSTLELIDPAADNRRAESWAASDESAGSAWQTVTYRATGAEPPGSNNPSTWREFLLGFLDAGEALIDDVSVIEDPDGTRISVIQNGTFEGDALGGGAAHWRLLGTHRLSRVETDPNGPGHVLRLVATGEFEHSYNTASTTLAANRAISPTKTYEISYRAKWLSGSPQLNSRLYLNRAARTTILSQPATMGTPGAANRRRVANAGPTFDHLRHSPLVPAASQPVRVSVASTDPQGIREMRLFYRVNAGAWQSSLMGDDGTGRWFGVIPGQIVNTLVQFYVQGKDPLDATAFFPAGGPASRAVYRVGDGGTSTQPVKNKMRLCMTAADAAELHNILASVSNYRWPCTVIYNDREVWYDADVRLRAAPYGRQGARAGWNIGFGSDAPFRGVQKSVVIDGAFNMPKGDGTGWLENTLGPSVNEMLYQSIARRSGHIPSSYDDIVYFQTPRTTEGNRRAQLKMTRFGQNFLEEEFPDGADGTVYKQELIYYPTSTVDGKPESTKNAYNAVLDTEIRRFGTSKDNYRINYLIQNNRDRDDYSRLIALGQAFDASSTTLYAATSAVMDTDNWMRVFALTALTGLADTYNNGLAHNIELYARPRDGKVMLFPWDQDHAFYYAPKSSVFGVGSHRLATILQLPANRRLFCAHLLELCQTGFTNDHLDPIITHLSTVADRPAYGPNLKTWVSQRRAYVLAQLNTLHPAVSFQITTNNGADFAVATPSAVLEGKGWLDVRTLAIARDGGAPEPVEVTWLDGQRWRVVVPLLRGVNALSLTAASALGVPAGTDTIAITNTGTIDPAAAENLVISEINYHPLNEEEEFIELTNVGATPIDLTGVRFTAGVQFDFTGSPAAGLAAGQRVVVVKNRTAFDARYGTGVTVAGAWSPLTELGNGGDRLTLVDRSGAIIADFSYGDRWPWPVEADGHDSSLTLIRPAIGVELGDGKQWRPSRLPAGSPGGSDSLPPAAFPSLLDYALVKPPMIAAQAPPLDVSWTERLGADEAVVTPEVSDTLSSWIADPGDGTALEWRAADSRDGARTLTVRLRPGWRFLRLRVSAP